MTLMTAQSTDCVLMVRPVCFFANPETAKTNEFQTLDEGPADGLAEAQREFDGAVANLRAHGVNVIVIDDVAEPETPDAIFPNNWLTTHADGACVLYPMQPESRRGERRLDVLHRLRDDYGKLVRHVIDWSGFERSELFLEGTGSLVLDRVHRVAYACRSARTHEAVLTHFCGHFDYTPVLFDAQTASGTAIYHTNVMMCVGTGYAIVCLESVRNEQQRRHLETALGQHHDIVAISLEQVAAFAGNMLEVQSTDGTRLLVLSSRALSSLSATQRAQLEGHATLVPCDVSQIESASGGSIRCMLAEIFLP